MTQTSRHKSKGSLLGGVGGGVSDDPNRGQIVNSMLPVERDCCEEEFSTLIHDHLTRERSIVAADGPPESVVTTLEPNRNDNPAEPDPLVRAETVANTTSNSTERSTESSSSHPDRTEKRPVMDPNEPTPQRARVTEAPRSSAIPRRRTELRVSHESGGGSSSSSTPQKRGRIGFARRARRGKTNPFDSLVVADESILDYLVSTVARWLERLRDRLLRSVAPSRNQQKSVSLDDTTESGEPRSTSARKKRSRGRLTHKSR
jgi:hypothetical protein